MTGPRRVQLRRTKGWRLQEVAPGAIKVDRSTKWGNPFADPGDSPSWRGAAVEAFRLENHRRPVSDFAELRGRDLACWCKPGDACHADVLLELANRPLGPVE